ncbi:MAG: hypothetical protein EXR24_07240 [Ignavibacteria bacterium]|nr:hypothetical protein [Ignavibacteria bacterium]
MITIKKSNKNIRILLDQPTPDNISYIVNELNGGSDNVSLSFKNINYLDTLTSVKSIKSIVKNEVNGVKFKVRGRGNRIKTFKQLGRWYSAGFSNQNDVSLNSAAGYFMNSFTLYFYLGR